ncbi:MAG: N-acetylglucosamine-6-phosphate deacetylase [Vicinamibacterales bacterium]
MPRLSGGRVVTPDGVLDGAVVSVADGRIVDVAASGAAAAGDVDCSGCWVLPGFLDTHVHGTDGVDVLAGPDAVAQVAAGLTRYGVTGFCPTSLACPPGPLAAFLDAVAAAQAEPAPRGARVLGAHLESNFLNPDYRGAQPASCLRLPPSAGAAAPDAAFSAAEAAFSAAEVLAVIEGHASAVAIVTLAPELPGALDLVRRLAGAGHRVSLGHSGATYDQAAAAIAAGARHATHLFNRMPVMSHRAPGLVGAVLAAGEVTCEIICDGVHVHPAWVRVAAAAKAPSGLVAITDATAGAGLPVGATARLGDLTIHVGERVATLADGTIAGSVTTMDRAFRFLVTEAGLSVPGASRLTSANPAAALGRADLGRLEPGCQADVVVMDEAFEVRQTWIAGRPVWNPDRRPHVSPAGGAP